MKKGLDRTSNAPLTRRSATAHVLAVTLAGWSGPSAALYDPQGAFFLGRINADPMLNPDERSRPSPIVLRFYELVAREAFEAADFVSLDKNDKTTLGADLAGREDLIIQPGEVRDLRKGLSPQTKFIALMAAYREIDKATWRAVMEVKQPTVKKYALNRVAIKLDSLAVQFRPINE